MKNIICKSILALAVHLALLLPADTAAQTWRWPMANHKAGENIVSQPSSYIDKEYNGTHLFIGGKEGDVVVSPVDGIVNNQGVNYIPHLSAVIGNSHDVIDSWDEQIAQFCRNNKSLDPQYITGCISIKIADGRKVHIIGLSGNYSFSVDQKISAGDTLGLLSWSYKGIREPSLQIEVSNADNTSSDPMAPFGLKSNFHIDKIALEDPLSVEKMREDLTILEKAVLELYPSLNDRMSDEAFHDSMEALRQSVTEPIPLLTPVPLYWFCHLLHDSHLAIMPERNSVKSRDLYIPQLYYLWIADTLRVLAAGYGFEQYNGKIVASIDGMTPHDYVEQTRPYTFVYDPGVITPVEEQLLLVSFYSLLPNYKATAKSSNHVVFTDGEEADIPFGKYPINIHTAGTIIPSFMNWHNLTFLDDPDSIYTTRHLNDSTDYLSIRTFDISNAKLNRILQWIGDCKTPNMIIDMRNNKGGDVYALNRLLACFAQQPLNRQRGGHLYVEKQGDFECLKYSENMRDEKMPFSDYVKLKGKPGYYNFDTVQTCSCIMPDSSHQYTGRVYVLTNGSSLSAATIFPSVLVRNRRGVSVGRETGSAYHYITALKEAQIHLPNTHRVVIIPLVKAVFDTTVCERTPWGRGLLPDYEVPLSYNEITMGADGETDVMLEYALQLIAEGKYLSAEDPFAETDAPKKDWPLWVWIIISLGAVASLAVFSKIISQAKKQTSV